MNFDITHYSIIAPHYYDYKTRVLVLSDIHDQHYDLLMDVISISYGALRFLEYCVGKTKTYYSLGNHEWMFDADDYEAIENIGCTLLNDRYIKTSDNAYVAGLNSPIKYERNGIIPEYYDPNIKWLNDYERIKGYKFLLYHHPEYYDNYLKNLNIDLIISGHAQGWADKNRESGLVCTRARVVS